MFRVRVMVEDQFVEMRVNTSCGVGTSGASTSWVAAQLAALGADRGDWVRVILGWEGGGERFIDGTPAMILEQLGWGW